MAAGGYVVEFGFGGLGLIPGGATAKIPDQGVSWDTVPARPHILAPL
jgi:uncharacterized protein